MVDSSGHDDGNDGYEGAISAKRCSKKLWISRFDLAVMRCPVSRAMCWQAFRNAGVMPWTRLMISNLNIEWK